MDSTMEPNVDGVPVETANESALESQPPAPPVSESRDDTVMLDSNTTQDNTQALVIEDSTPSSPHRETESTSQETLMALELSPAPAPVVPAASAEVSMPLKSKEDVFKVPAVPASATARLNGLPADIEHILSLGANEGDKEEDLAPTSNYEKVVKDMREKAGFAMKEDGLLADKEGELDNIQKEMEAGGVTRAIKEEEVEEVLPAAVGKDQDEIMDVTLPASAVTHDSSSSSSSSDSSSTDSDSDAVPTRATPSSSEATPSASRTRTRKRPQKKRANDSDLSDDDVNSGPVGSAPKTEHEVALPEISLPEIAMLPADVEIAVVGKIESLIETVVVLRASTAGDWRVLDEGTVCCWEDKTVVGAIFETFGSVQQPFYSLRFPPSAIPDPAVFTVGRSVFYAPKMASFVFTRDIRGIKGSDASNIWDEEVGAAEMEWSDDEAEQEYKRSQKADRRSRTASATPGPSRQNSRAPSVSASHLPARPQPSPLSYEDDSYTPLQRPRDLHLMGDAPPPPSEGRRMFERDTGKNTRGGGAEVEFEFSDDEAEAGMSARNSGRGGRGGARGRGEGRGRGRG
ncbi:H/ACA ribonucleoprotein complex non-core subunit NAF1, partial [Phenoliferia sp. Uapishka_3]